MLAAPNSPPALLAAGNPNPPAGFEAAGVLKLNAGVEVGAPKAPAAGAEGAPNALLPGVPNAGAEAPKPPPVPKAGVLLAPNMLAELGAPNPVLPNAGVDAAAASCAGQITAQVAARH